MAGTISATIFDVDGVLVNSPHERAWREALAGFADPAQFTTTFYQAYVAASRGWKEHGRRSSGSGWRMPRLRRKSTPRRSRR